MRWPAVSCFLILAGCATQPAEQAKTETKQPVETKRYEIRGEVKELDAQAKIAKIQHEQIGDWMGAMTMEFPVKDTADFAKLKVGQKVKATVFVHDLEFWVGEVQDEAPAPASK